MDKFHGKYRISSARLQNWDYASKGMYFITICTKNREHYFGNIIKPNPDMEHYEMHLSDIGKILETEWLKTPGIRPDMNLTIDEYQVMPNHFHAILIIGENRFNTTELIYETNKNSVSPRRDAMLASPINSEPENEPEFKPHSDSDNQTKFELERQTIFELERQTIFELERQMKFELERQMEFELERQTIFELERQIEFELEMQTAFELEMQMISETHAKGKNKFAPQTKNLGSVMRGLKSAVTKFANDNNIVFNWQPRYYDHIIRNYNEYNRISNYIRNNPDNWGNDHLR